MSFGITKLSGAMLLVLGGTLAPLSVGSGSDEDGGVIRLNRACATSTEFIPGFEEEGGRGCTLDENQICETVRNDYTGYRNN